MNWIRRPIGFPFWLKTLRSFITNFLQWWQITALSHTLAPMADHSTWTTMRKLPQRTGLTSKLPICPSHKRISLQHLHLFQRKSMMWHQANSSKTPKNPELQCWLPTVSKLLPAFSWSILCCPGICTKGLDYLPLLYSLMFLLTRHSQPKRSTSSFLQLTSWRPKPPTGGCSQCPRPTSDGQDLLHTFSLMPTLKSS